MAAQADPFADARSRQDQLFKLLASSPVIDVLGVVGPMGVSGGKFHGEEFWTLKITMEAWRIHASELQTRPLTIRRKVAKEDLASFRELVRPYNVIRIRARVISQPPFGGPEALLEEFVGLEGSDAELNDYTMRLQKPIVHEDSLLGTFALDRQVNLFRGKASWNGRPISVNLKAKDPAKVQEASATAHALWAAQDVWDQRVRDYAAKALLPVKNKSWLSDDEVPVSADQFKQKMAMESVTVYPNGSFEFWYADGGLFLGHSIQISGTLSEGPTHANIVG